MMEAVQVLIERLASHPEDFFGDVDAPHVMRTPKFADIVEKLDDLLAGDVGQVKSKNFHRLWFLNEDETTALLDAYKEARRVRFEAKIFHTLMRPELNEDERTVKYKASGRYSQNLGASMANTKNAIAGGIMSGFTDPRATFGSAVVKTEGASVIRLDSNGIIYENNGT